MMNLATIVVTGVYANARRYATIPAGIVGATVTFEFTDPIWEGLTKTAVFQGSATRDVVVKGNTVTVPQEVVNRAGPMLKVGVYGVDAEKNLVVPTLWAAIGGIRDAADPSGDPGTDPELPIWAQLAAEVEKLKLHGGATDEQIQKAVSDYLQKNPIEKLTEEELVAAIKAYFEKNPIDVGSDVCVVYVDNNPAMSNLILTSKTSDEIFDAWLNRVPIYGQYNSDGIALTLRPNMLSRGKCVFHYDFPMSLDATGIITIEGDTVTDQLIIKKTSVFVTSQNINGNVVYSANATSDQILKAYEQNAQISCHLNMDGKNVELNLVASNENLAVFSNSIPSVQDLPGIGVVIVISGENVSYYEWEVVTKEDILTEDEIASIVKDKTEEIIGDTLTEEVLGAYIKEKIEEALKDRPGSGGNVDQGSVNVGVPKVRINPTEPLNITTYEGGGNQPTHPKALHFSNGWNGHKYWMVYTPYPNNNNFHENPCITYSDDGINWSEEGISNPIIASEHNGCWWSDPHLVYIPDTNTMELWVRWCSNGADGMDNGWEGVYRLKSTDGVNWSDKEYLYHVVDTGWASVLSPSVIYDEGKYKIWFCYKRNCLKYYESADGTNWQYKRDIVVNPTGSSYKIWHFDIIKTSKGYEFVGSYQLNGSFDKNNFIYYSTSQNNVGYKYPVRILTNGYDGRFDRLELYRPCLLKMNDGTDHEYYNLYYGAQGALRNWAIGLVQASDIESLKFYIDQEASYVDSYLEADTEPGEDGDDVEVILSSISATYSGGNVSVGTAVTDLTGVVVTAHYSDGSAKAVTGYTLSGTIAEGSNTVTVTYGGKTTTFTVIGIAESGGDDTVTEGVVSDFEESNWSVGYINDNGEVDTSLNMHHSDLIEIPTSRAVVKTTVAKDTVLRVSYFDADRNYLGYDRGKGLNQVSTDYDNNQIYLIEVANAVYFAISCNTAYKSEVFVVLDAVPDIDTTDATAVYVISNRGNNDSAWADSKGGASASVTGGVWNDECLSLDGTDDYISLPVTNASKLKIAFKSEQIYANVSANIGYLLDCRPTAMNYLFNGAPGGCCSGLTFTIDDIPEKSMDDAIDGMWHEIAITFDSAFTGTIRIGSKNDGTELLQCDIGWIAAQ